MRVIMEIKRNNFRKLLLTKISVIIILLIASSPVWAADETFNAGAYIIDMGTSNQTYNTGLKPYGLVYDLIVNENVPVHWAIDPDKLKDQADFDADGYSYKGGSFIIPVEYLSSSVLSVISTWQGQGVKVDGPISNSFTAPIYTELTSWPRAVLDEDNGSIVEDYYINAGVPSSSYQLAGNPTNLTGCYDVYVLPHADPHLWDDSWGQALYDFIVNDQGYLWSACRAVSALETLVDFNNDGNPDCNFLSDTELQLWDNRNYPAYDEHDDGTPPYTYDDAYSGDPIMQFIDSLDIATQEGSEQIYIPMAGMTWRSTTKNAVYDPDHPENPAGDYASVLVYGHAFGNTNYGMVMYEAGHDHDKASNPTNVAAQRAFFNFVLMAGVDKEISVSSNVATSIVSGSTINISASGSDGTAPYTYEWTSTCTGGSFGDATSSSTTYTAPTVESSVTCVITVQVTDDCGRFSLGSTTVVVAPPIGPTAVDDDATTPMNAPVDINVLSNDTEGDAALDPTSVSFVSGTEPNPATEGTFTVNNTTGLVTFTPINGYMGTVTIDYEVCDLNSLCSQATINVTVISNGDMDSDGVPDNDDDYPNDPDRAFNNYYPSGGNGTLAYEDLWPGKGDYDFNDLVIEYRFKTVTSSSNHIVETFATFIVKAFGASHRNGFGFQLANNNIDAANITSVTGYDLQEGYINLEANGIEEGQSIPTIIVYDNAYNILVHPGPGIGVNADPSAPYVEPETLNIYISYSQGTYTLAELDIPNFNPFIIVNRNRNIEVHLPDYHPTDLADQSVFGTSHDDTNPANGKYYKTVNNLPWAINIPEPFEYPIEKTDITSVYLKFAAWAESSGQLYPDWYLDEVGYRDNALIYSPPD